MRILSILAVAATASLAGACATGGQSAALQSTSVDPSLERLLFAWAGPDSIQVRVASNGCTEAESFDVAVGEEPGAAGTYRLAITRIERDDCRGYKPEGERLEFSRAELGVPAGAAVTFANPVGRS
jgi:hypothetical protein